MKLSISMTRNEVRFGWLFLALQLLVLPVLLVLVNALLPVPLSNASLNFLMFVIDFGLALLIFHRFLLASARFSAAAPFRCLRFAAIGLILYYLATFLVGMFIQAVYPDFSNANDSSIHSMAQENYSLMLAGTVLLVPVTEETLYRGLVFRGLREKSRVAGYILSTLFFALIHVTGYMGAVSPTVLLLCLLQYIPAGICLAWAYEKADSIWTPILMHMAINQISMSYMR